MKNSLPDIHVPGQMADAIQEAYSALFEAGGSPQKKTRKAIRNLLPPPPGGWDAPAQDQDGDSYVSARGNKLTWDQVLETHIRGLFFHNSGILEKYEPAIARIAYTELGVWPGDLMDYRQDSPAPVPLNQFKAILKILSGQAHEGEYDFNLNGMSYDELVSKYGKSAGRSESSAEDTGHLNYRVELIPNFQVAQRYGHYTNGWCICSSKSYWNRYTARGRNTMYFLLAPGFETLTNERGEHFPYDRYSLSMIGAVIAPDGSLEYCCLRRNHEGGLLGDHELGEYKLGQLLGRPVETALPYVKPEGYSSKGIEEYRKRLANGETPESIYGTVASGVIDGLSEYLINGGNDMLLVDTTTWLPLSTDELVETVVLDEHTVAVKYVQNTDQWGEDQCAWFLYSTKYRRLELMGYDNSDWGDDWDDRREDGFVAPATVYDIQSTGCPDVYKVVANEDNVAPECLVGLSPTGPTSLSGWHEEIVYYPNDRVFVMDEDENSWNEEDDIVLEIVKVLDDGSTEVQFHDFPETAVSYAADGKINMLIEDSDGTKYLLHNGELKSDVFPEYDTVRKLNRCPYLVSMVDEDDNFAIFSLKTGEFIMQGESLASRDGIYRHTEVVNEDDVYTMRNGLQNIITDNGPLFREGQKSITALGSITNTPFSLARHNLNVIMSIDTDGKSHFIDTESGNDLYGRALPANVRYPYNDKFYVGRPADDNGIALFDLDGKQVSPPFNRLLNGTGFVQISDHYNILDPDTGKFVFEENLLLPPSPISSERVEPEGDQEFCVSMYRIRNLAGKDTLLVARCERTRNSSGFYLYGPVRFSDPGVGWHDGVEGFPNCAALAIISDRLGTKKLNARMTVYITHCMVYDNETGKLSKPMDMDWLKKKLQELARRDNNLPRGAVYTNLAIAKSVAKIPDFVSWLDNLPREEEENEN